MGKRFYLDTSAVRSRLFGHSSIQTILFKKLENTTRITSPYVKMEFERGFICNLIEFYFFLKKQTSLRDALKYWAEDFRIRKLKDVDCEIVDIFLGVKSDSDINRALLNLRNEIKKILALFSHLITRFERNETSCYCYNFRLDLTSNVSTEVEKSFLEFYHKYYKYNYSQKCKIVDFFDKNKEILKKIQEYDSKQAGYKKQQANLAKISSKNIMCGHCGTVGDTIIALECPNYAVLLTTDKVFVDLCNVIGIKCHIVDCVRKIKPLSEFLEVLRPKGKG